LNLQINHNLELSRNAICGLKALLLDTLNTLGV